MGLQAVAFILAESRSAGPVVHSCADGIRTAAPGSAPCVPVVVTSPAPRRVRTPNWLDLRLVAGVLLVVGSVAVGLLVIANAGSTRRVWAVRHDVGAGTVLGAADVVPAKLRLTHGSSIYIPSDSTKGTDIVVGKTVNRPIGAGELLPRDALGGGAPVMTMTVPLTSDQAPKIASGQKITLWVSTKTCQAKVVVGGVLVKEVDGAGGGSFGTSSTENVVVSLDPGEADQVITALDLDGAVVRAGVLSDPDRVPPPDDLKSCGAAS